MKYGKKLVAAALAMSMASAPAVAQTSAASSLSVARVGASLSEGNELRGAPAGEVIVGVLVVAIVLIMLMEGNGGRPKSS